MDERRSRRGVSLVEVLVVVFIVGVFVLIALFALPRQRESARLNDCRRNLMQIGVALALYDKSKGYLPSVPPLDTETSRNVDSPLKALLTTLALPDFSHLDDSPNRKKDPPSPVPSTGLIPGFYCQSDPYVLTEPILASISYRATTGDQPAGVNGAFAPGTTTRMSDIENGDGRGYTAAFAERLVGNKRPDDRAPVNYLICGPVIDSRCPEEVDPKWFGDAGSSWSEIGWRSTLYNHTMTPNGSPSCIARDSRTALIGASSGHLQGVNVLMFDGSVRTVSPGIESRVWKAMATTATPEPANPPFLQEPR